MNKQRYSKRSQHFLLQGICLCLGLFMHNALNAEAGISASLLKAVYTYKFANFTHWPDSAADNENANFNLCILGTSPFSKAELAQIENKQVKQRKLQTHIYERGMISAEALQSCEIAFISASEQHRLPIILTELQGQPILTVSDIEGFSRLGGMITLVQEQQRIVFQINNEEVESSTLSISSKILELSQIVSNKDTPTP